MPLFPVSLFFHEVLSFLSSLGGLDEIHTGDQSEQVSLPSEPIKLSRFLRHDEFLCAILTCPFLWHRFHPGLVGLSASTTAFAGVHQRQLYCFCMVRLFRVFLRPPVCTPGGIVKVCLGSCVFTHPRPQRWPHHATDREASTCVWRFPKWPGLEKGHAACAAFQQSGPTLAALGGEGWGVGIIGRALQCFQKHRLLAASLNMMEKNACC